MITADEARKIADSKVKDEHNSPLFKFAIDQIESHVRNASRRGERSISYNVCALAPGCVKPSLHLRKAVAEELRKNGYSYRETRRSLNSVWFEVNW
jgi:hypothetical protein